MTKHSNILSGTLGSNLLLGKKYLCNFFKYMDNFCKKNYTRTFSANHDNDFCNLFSTKDSKILKYTNLKHKTIFEKIKPERDEYVIYKIIRIKYINIKNILYKE